jgi:zinc transport system permease protein
VDWLIEPLSQEFMQRALFVGAVFGALCAAIGVFVVQRGLSFIGDGLAHAAFGGIALGLVFFEVVEDATWVALPFTIAVALGIAFVLRRAKMRGDVATGVFFAVSFALGIVFLHAREPLRELLGLGVDQAPRVDPETILFGSILAIAPEDIYVVAVVAAVTTVVLLLTWSRMAYATFDPELATLSGVPVKWLDYTLLALTAVVIVVSVRAVGVVLVSSFVVIPAATSRMLTRTMAGMALLAVVIGLAGSSVGLILSYQLDVPSGATIILLLGAVFFVALLVAARRR